MYILPKPMYFLNFLCIVNVKFLEVCFILFLHTQSIQCQSNSAKQNGAWESLMNRQADASRHTELTAM